MTANDEKQVAQPRRSGLTWLVVAASTALTAPLALVGVVSLLQAAGVLGVDVEQSVRDRTILVGVANTESSLRIAAGWLAAVTLPLAVVGTILTLGLLTLREWAREAGMGLFGLSGLLITMLSIYGLQDTPGRNTVAGLVGGVLVMGLAGLLMSPPCRDDVDRAETARRVRTMRAAEAARRRAAHG